MNDRCAKCARVLVEDARWSALSSSLRRQLGTTHARNYGGGLCQTCATWRTRRATDDPNLAYEGGWVRRGLILVPDMPRPVDRPDVGRGAQPINHGTDGGYHVHRRRCETPCDACRDAHRAAEREREARKREVAA